MTTHLNLLADKPGEFPGFSANFSGDGFAEMRFIAKAVPAGDFDGWVAQVRGAGSALDGGAYAELAKPSKAVPPTTYRSVEPRLFDRIIEQTVSGSPSPLPRNAGAGSIGAGDGAAWRPPVQEAGG
jgi:cytochrome o ubiquinol oxidase subunit 2